MTGGSVGLPVDPVMRKPSNHEVEAQTGEAKAKGSYEEAMLDIWVFLSRFQAAPLETRDR